MKEEIFKNLGIKLRDLREKTGMGIKEAARVVGVDFSYLAKIEKGQEKPSKSLLNALIYHYGVSNVDQANRLFALAGYMRIGGKEVEKMATKDLKDQVKKQSTIRMPIDMPILYSDAVTVNANQFGFVLNFTQQLGPGEKLVVSRIGMSQEHIKALIKVLNGLLLARKGKRVTRKVALN